jgi:hypothetical protein
MPWHVRWPELDHEDAQAGFNTYLGISGTDGTCASYEDLEA